MGNYKHCLSLKIAHLEIIFDWSFFTKNYPKIIDINLNHIFYKSQRDGR